MIKDISHFQTMTPSQSKKKKRKIVFLKNVARNQLDTAILMFYKNRLQTKINQEK